MESVSVSKGVFAHKGSYTIGRKKRKTEKNEYCEPPWYKAYKETWSAVEKAAEEINTTMFEQILLDLKNYVAKIKNSSLENYSNEISTAILLTGVNLPDHAVLFKNLAKQISIVTDHVAIVRSQECGNMKSLIEETVFQLINGQDYEEKPDIKRKQCTLRLLEAWHGDNCEDNEPFVIIVPDFESFVPSVLRDFILVLSAYTKSMKFVLVFGVATTLHAVHRCLSYDVTSKLRVQVFHTQTQVKSLSDVLEGTVLSGKTPFKLTGRAFQLLTDIFLFYDFSVHGFLQGYKLCMLQHFYDNNYTSLCCDLKDVKKRLELLNSEDFKEIRKLPSIADYVEKNYKERNEKSVQLNDEDFKKLLVELLENYHHSIDRFLTILKCLHILTSELPGSPLGKQLREMYAAAVTSDVAQSQGYKESFQFLGFLAKEEFVPKLEAVLRTMKNCESPGFKNLSEKITRDLSALRNASLEVVTTPSEATKEIAISSRVQLKEKLLKMSQCQKRSPYKQLQSEMLEYLRDIFALHLRNPSRLVANEIFCFNDANAARHPIRGSHRAAIHTALTNPQVYLECGCCTLEDEHAIQANLPDLSIIYKLHLESRKLINMYDWLQAFLTIVNPGSDDHDEQRDVDPRIQVRFTQAIAELQFLGFIKTSRKKTDHVKRLT